MDISFGIDCWNQAASAESSMILRSAGGGGSERNDATPKVGICDTGCLTPWDKQTIRVYGPMGAFCSISSNTGGGQNRQSVLAFAQNTRDEVRILGTDGQVAGALDASPGTHQTTYLAERKT